MEYTDFALIQEMADAQEYLDDVMYKEFGKNMPSQRTNNEFILIRMGALFSTICGCEYAEFDKHHIDWLTFEKLVELWAVVLRTTRNRKTYDVQKWLFGKHLNIDWINMSSSLELHERAAYIVMYDARSKMKNLIKLTEELGYSIENVHKRFMENVEIKRLELDVEKMTETNLGLEKY